MWVYLLGGAVLIGGGYFAYTYYEKQQANSLQGQLTSLASGAITQATSTAKSAVANAKYFSPAYDVYDAAKAISGWF